MYNLESIQAVDNSLFSKEFIKPLYDSFCFSKIPTSIYSLLTGKEPQLGLPPSCFIPKESYDAVFLFFLDGFAWRFCEHYKDHPFLHRFYQSGIVSKLTAQFPSTTAAEVSTIHTGLEVGQTGIYEWFQYEPQVDRIIAPLLFAYAGDKIAHSLLGSEISPSSFFPFKTIYQKMHSEEITSYLFQHASLTSPYAQSASKEAHVTSYFTLKQGLSSIKELMSKEVNNKIYGMFYYSNIDSVGHRKGVDSQELKDEILSTLDLLEEMMQSLVKTDKKIAILVTADHGMSRVDPNTTIYLNQELPQFSSFLKRGKDGALLVPAGSCRDFFLYVKEDCLEEAFILLTDFFQGKGEVWKVSDLISLGFFGSQVSSRFLERVGNIVVLPYEGESVWWFEKHRFEQHFYGAHGGLTREELEISFLFGAF